MLKAETEPHASVASLGPARCRDTDSVSWTNQGRYLGLTRAETLLALQEQLVASGDRERELQRQLTQAGLQAEALLEGSQAAAAAESEQLVKGLIQQRDTANEALLVGSCLVSCMYVAETLVSLP